MFFNTAYLNTPKSQDVENYLKKRIGNYLRKMTDSPVALDLTFDRERLDHVVHLKYRGENGEFINLVQKENDFYRAIDGVAKRFGRRLRASKSKRNDRRVRVRGVIEELEPV